VSGRKAARDRAAAQGRAIKASQSRAGTLGKASHLPEDLLTKTSGGVQDMSKSGHLPRKKKRKKRK